MEEGWYQTSTAGQNYIEINESELDEILDFRRSDNLVQEAKAVDELFRF